MDLLEQYKFMKERGILNNHRIWNEILPADDCEDLEKEHNELRADYHARVL